MADIFLSYSRPDTARARQIKQALESLGLTVFFDTEGLDGGDVFPDVLDREVKSAGAVVGIWSRHSIARPWVKVECDIGRERGVLCPVQIEEIPKMEVPAVFWNLQVDDLSDFAGDPAHRGWLRFVRSLGSTMERPELLEKESERLEAAQGIDDAVMQELLALRAELKAMREAQANPPPGSKRPRLALWTLLALLFAGVLAAYFRGYIPGTPPAQRRTAAAASAMPAPQTWRHTTRIDAGGGWVYSAVFSPDGARIAAAAGNTAARIFDPVTGEEVAVLEGHTDSVTAAAWSPDGLRLATASMDGAIRTWDPASGRLIKTFTPGSGGVRTVTYSADGAVLVFAAGKQGEMIDANLGTPAGASPPGEADVYDAALSPDGALLATAAEDGVRIWKAPDWSLALQLWSHEIDVLSVAFSPDGSRLASADAGGVVKVWSLEGGRELLTLTGEDSSVMRAVFSPDGTRILTASRDGTAKIHDAATGTEIAKLAADLTQLFDAGWAPDGKRIVTGSWDGTADVWELQGPAP